MIHALTALSVFGHRLSGDDLLELCPLIHEAGAESAPWAQFPTAARYHLAVAMLVSGARTPQTGRGGGTLVNPVARA